MLLFFYSFIHGASEETGPNGNKRCIGLDKWPRVVIVIYLYPSPPNGWNWWWWSIKMSNY